MGHYWYINDPGDEGILVVVFASTPCLQIFPDIRTPISNPLKSCNVSVFTVVCYGVTRVKTKQCWYQNDPEPVESQMRV